METCNVSPSNLKFIITLIDSKAERSQNVNLKGQLWLNRFLLSSQRIWLLTVSLLRTWKEIQELLLKTMDATKL